MHKEAVIFLLQPRLYYVFQSRIKVINEHQWTTLGSDIVI